MVWILITAILFEPKEINDIEYLQYNLNFLRGYIDYLNNDVICAGYSDGDELAVQAGIIKEIINKSEFYHNVGTMDLLVPLLYYFNYCWLLVFIKQAKKKKD